MLGLWLAGRVCNYQAISLAKTTPIPLPYHRTRHRHWFHCIRSDTPAGFGLRPWLQLTTSTSVGGTIIFRPFGCCPVVAFVSLGRVAIFHLSKLVVRCSPSHRMNHVR